MDKSLLLDKITSPADLRRLKASQLPRLCEEIRDVLVQTVSETGGHLASNMGTVELTVMLHRVFRSPTDQLVWDVGHQSYTHKLLTGRKSRFSTLRQENGLSGFTRQSESVHDSFISGHSSTSISAADGISRAKSLLGEEGHVVAVIGDGAFTGGLAFEGLNNIARNNKKVIVILNDNKMSISKNVGGLTSYLSRLRAHQGYFKLKDLTKDVLGQVPGVGDSLVETVTASKNFLKQSIYHTSFFEDLGFVHFGPVDGHNLKMLEDVLVRAKSLNQPVLIHVETIKGKGYMPAEKNPGAYHAVAPFNPALGADDTPRESFSTVFGKTLVKLAGKDRRICGVTAAMKYATGMDYFARRYKNAGRFFDVGIAEGHGVTFCAGLASKGMIPVFAVYSSFLQRAYDQVLHDCAIERQHMVLAVDRAGIVGDDGETHQGVFDCAFLSSVPGVSIYSPALYSEVEYCLEKALFAETGICAVRYPRGGEPELPASYVPLKQDYFHLDSGSRSILLITYGRLYAQACQAVSLLAEKGIAVSVLKLTKVCPLEQAWLNIAMQYESVLFAEEGIRAGGIGEHTITALALAGYHGNMSIAAIENQFVAQGKPDAALARLGLDEAGLARTIEAQLTERKRA
ncbi:1-deoxy-D-xylulose-5-phosphate synthase [Oscillospiraceae bacterium MB08-C2-2]|nr:1-deoxy-D-xylulose-5-phosphate synthase [Oscillospiraceae bacterium MB08-C2-2]